MAGLLRRLSGRTVETVRASGRREQQVTCTDPAEVERVLRGLCERQVHAEVVCGGGESTVFGRFCEHQEGVVRLEVLGGDVGHAEPLTMCIVTSHADDVARVFFSSLLGVDREGSPPSLWLLAPRAIAGADGRFTFRVPVIGESGLRVSVSLGGGLALAVRPLDISLTGARIELPPDCPMVLSTGARVHLRFQLGSRTVELDSTVRRAQGSTYGLYFGGLLQSRGELVVPDTWVEIVQELERQWTSQAVTPA